MNRYRKIRPGDVGYGIDDIWGISTDGEMALLANAEVVITSDVTALEARCRELEAINAEYAAKGWNIDAEQQRTDECRVRIAELESALRKIATGHENGVSCVFIAHTVLGSEKETGAKQLGKVVPRCTSEHDMRKEEEGIFCHVCGIADYQLNRGGVK